LRGGAEPRSGGKASGDGVIPPIPQSPGALADGHRRLVPSGIGIAECSDRLDEDGGEEQQAEQQAQNGATRDPVHGRKHQQHQAGDDVGEQSWSVAVPTPPDTPLTNQQNLGDGKDTAVRLKVEQNQLVAEGG